MDLDARRREGLGRRAQELRDLLVGEFDGVGYGRGQERGQRGPGAGGAPEGEEGVHPGPGTERGPGPAGARPDLGGVRDQAGVGDPVQLEHRPEAGCLPRFRGEAGQFEPEREPDARVVHGRHVGGPRPVLGNGPGFVGREGGPAGRERGRRGSGQRVGHRIGERAEQRLGLGQQQGFVWGQFGCVAGHAYGGGQRDRVGGRRHRGSERAEFGQFTGAERPGAPRVVVAGCEAGQQEAARDEVQGEEGRGAPEGGRGGGGVREPGTGEQRQGVPYGQGAGGDGHDLERVAVDDRDPGVVAGSVAGVRQRFAVGQRFTVRRPEGDLSGAGRLGGKEDGGVAEEFVRGGGFLGGFAGRIIGSVRERQRIPQI